MITQLSCLIFGWIRSRRGSEKKIYTPKNINHLGESQTIHYLDRALQKRPDYISFYDPTVEYYMVDVNKYLPEQRYRR